MERERLAVRSGRVELVQDVREQSRVMDAARLDSARRRWHSSSLASWPRLSRNMGHMLGPNLMAKKIGSL